jgi:DNA-3-methyladenine glycosylase
MDESRVNLRWPNGIGAALRDRQRHVTVKPLDRTFFDRPTLDVAKDLLGCLLVHDAPAGRLAGRIVETEGYTRDDPALHGWKATFGDEGFVLPEGRAADLFAAPGTSYVYLIYFSNWLLNVVTEPEGVPGAVLIRALEPVEGVEVMRGNRPAARRDRDLTNGPAKLTQALGVASGDFHGIDLTEPPLFFAIGEDAQPCVVDTSCRIGLTRGIDRPWRFFERGNPFVSPGVPSDVKHRR